MAIPKPPANVKAAVPVALASVVAESATTPAELIATASVSDADPIFPAFGITTFPPVVRVPPPPIVPANVTFAPLK